MTDCHPDEGTGLKDPTTLSTNPYQVNRERCQNLDIARSLEWMVTNGRGGCAMATVNQMLTRRYHGLLVAAVEPPVERFVLLAKLDVVAECGSVRCALSTNDYASVVEPHGYRHLESFTTKPCPTWMWRVGDALIEQTLCMFEGEDTTFVRYRLVEGEMPVDLVIRPLCTSRHFHHLAHQYQTGSPVVHASGETIAMEWGPDRPSWQLSFNGEFHAHADWYYGFELATDRARGYDHQQDLFLPGTIQGALRPGDAMGLVIAASTQKRSWHDWGTAFDQAMSREQGVEDRVRDLVDDQVGEDPLVEPFVRAASDFVVSRDADAKTIIAGYPWFADWGRDSFIALPGLCLVTGRIEEARRIIEAFANYVDGGMIPNRFPDFGGPPAYNTVDATLWYVHAIDRYLTYSGNWEFIADRMFGVITEILDAHVQGTRHGIGLCQDGLLVAGEGDLALTWMDAQLEGRGVTPRIGKAVEIEALWFNALSIAAKYAERLGDGAAAANWHDRATRARESFNARFWNESSGCLYDVIDVDHQRRAMDGSVRPNQLIAISLTHPILERDRWAGVVDICRRLLWTPMGLRTLSPDDPEYCGRYGGDVVARDEAYHQGTVWPWLLGPFVSAYVRARGGTAQVRADAREFLAPLMTHLPSAGVGSVSEVADGDAPHTPGGCPWQAWSVAEPLRALCEDVLQVRPEQLNGSPVAEVDKVPVGS